MATIDAMTGLPTISVDARVSSDPSSVNTVMNAVENHVKGRKVCVVFDEFQDILDVKDGEQMLALTDIQLRVLRALAVQGGEHPLSNAFLERRS